MNGDERSTLEVFRAETNGKLDLLVERTANITADLSDHELRLRSMENAVAPVATLAAKQIQSLSDDLVGVKARMWMAVGGLSVLVFVTNIGISKGWF